ncbi:unnamed protein product [Umbelopsis vinacea]
MKSVRKCLNIQPKVTLRTLGVALGCTSMIPYVEKFFDEFQKRYIASLSAAKKMATSDELALPRWKGGAFYICSKSLGARLEKDSLAKMCSCTTIDLTRVAKIMEEHCKDLIVQLKQKNTRAARPTRGKREASDEPNEDVKENTGTKNLKRQRTKSNLSTENEMQGTSTSPQAKRKAKTDGKVDKKMDEQETAESIVLEERKTPVSGIVSMISGQHYKDTKRSATNRLITAKDHASVQINVGEVDASGRYTGSFTTYALSGFVRKESEADDSINRLATQDGLLKNVWSYQK